MVLGMKEKVQMSSKVLPGLQSIVNRAINITEHRLNSVHHTSKGYVMGVTKGKKNYQFLFTQNFFDDINDPKEFLTTFEQKFGQLDIEPNCTYVFSNAPKQSKY